MTSSELTRAQQTLGDKTGPQYWRSLEELAETAEFQEYVHREFPQAASEWNDDVSRRNFMKLMSASLALAGVTGCVKQPEEKIIPYVDPPEVAIPGKPTYYATAYPKGAYGLGVLVESHMGRPTKIEGNLEHPASLGATDAPAQASILGLYDPDRSQTARKEGEISTWAAFLKDLDAVLVAKRASHGAGLRILTQNLTSPTLIAQIQSLLKQLPQAKWHQYDVLARDNSRAAAQQAFGRPVNTVYQLKNAQRIVSLDSDFLQDDPGSVRYAREFIDARRVRVYGEHGHQQIVREGAEGQADAALMNRLYVVESNLSITGAMADHRLATRSSDIEAIARALAAALGVNAGGAAPQLNESQSKWVAEVAKDLKDHPDVSVILVGEHQPAAVHVLAHAMNAAIGAVGKTVTYTESIDAAALAPVGTIEQLVDDIAGNAVDTLLIIGGNPAYDAPADLQFGKVLETFSDAQLENGKRRNFTAHLSLYYDETSFVCQWHLPMSHYLEAWSDIRAYDGTVTIQQPLISPLYATHSAHEFLAALAGDATHSGHDLVRGHWQTRHPDDFETFWSTALHNGHVQDSAAPVVNVSLAGNALANGASPTQPAAGNTQGNAVEIVFRPDPNILDGRYSNNTWLQELPKPITKLTWDNAALMSAATAKSLGLPHVADHLTARPMVSIKVADQTVEAPVLVVPGHADQSITLHLGYGRRRAGQVGGNAAAGVGVNAYLLRRGAARSFTSEAEIARLDRRYDLAITQQHQMIDLSDLKQKIAPGSRIDELVQVHSLGQLEQEVKGHGEPHKKHVHLSLYPEWDYETRYGVDENGKPEHQHAWGMAIDMNACIGCNACVVACQAENNIPVVGKEQVMVNREMHWLRIDTYYKGNAEHPEGPYFQPMLCQHCENAPCEVVCPVAATTHSAEGLNEMTYNRCVGTRYCSNNCPYKVRRFNFLTWTDHDTPVLKLLRNPDVSVRNRGVMEKCTYCVQRINSTRIELKKLDAAMAEATDDQKKQSLQREWNTLLGQLETACQQSCPTEAIVFGDLNQKQHKVNQLKSQPDELMHNAVLDGLNTQPRTTYLARLKNPNEALGTPAVSPGHEPRNVEAKG